MCFLWKAFSQSRNLKNHIKTIYEEKCNYKCDSFGKYFTTAGYLKIKTIHKEWRKYKCDFCDKSFIQ